MYLPIYSGPNRSGICKCGHRWDEHHLGVVARQEYIEQTGECYIPHECEHYSCNEYGGYMPVKQPDGTTEWEYHCGSYRDSKEQEE
jgi:hypothetical protein